jgi:hypothetical protein
MVERKSRILRIVRKGLSTMPRGGYATVMRWLFDGYAEIMQVGPEDGLLPPPTSPVYMGRN